MEAGQRHWLQVHQVALTEQKMNDNMTVEDRKWAILTWVWIHGRHRSNSLNKTDDDDEVCVVQGGSLKCQRPL